MTASCTRAEKLFNDMQKDGKGNAELKVIVGRVLVTIMTRVNRKVMNNQSMQTDI